MFDEITLMRWRILTSSLSTEKHMFREGYLRTSYPVDDKQDRWALTPTAYFGEKLKETGDKMPENVRVDYVDLQDQVSQGS